MDFLVIMTIAALCVSFLALGVALGVALGRK